MGGKWELSLDCPPAQASHSMRAAGHRPLSDGRTCRKSVPTASHGPLTVSSPFYRVRGFLGSPKIYLYYQVSDGRKDSEVI